MKKVIFAVFASILLIACGGPRGGPPANVGSDDPDAPRAAANECSTDALLDVEADPANDDLDDPILSASCTDDALVIESNGIPNYEFVAVSPGVPRGGDFSFSIPLVPAGYKSAISEIGAVAVLVNGVPAYGPNEGGNLGFGDPYLDELLDYCGGHNGPTGYHNHAPPVCLFDDYETSVGRIVGYSLDGWPILTPYECANDDCSELVELQSSWQLTNPDIEAAWDKHEYVAGSGDLDQCNGKVQPDGTYAYYATRTFPYFLGCYINGELSASQ